MEAGEWFYTSGDDRIFPRGFPVGVVKVVRAGQPFQEILVEPSGLQRGVEDVLIVVTGVHQDIPDTPPANQPVYIAPPPPAPAAAAPGTAPETPPALGTEADKLRQLYKAAGESQNHKYGEGEPGSKPPDFTKLGQPPPGASAATPAATPATGGRAGGAEASAPAATGGRSSTDPPAASPPTATPASPSAPAPPPKRLDPTKKPPADAPSTPPAAAPAGKGPVHE